MWTSELTPIDTSGQLMKIRFELNDSVELKKRIENAENRTGAGGDVGSRDTVPNVSAA